MSSDSSTNGEAGAPALVCHLANMEAHDTVEESTCLLRIYQVDINTSRILNGILDSVFRNFPKYNTSRFCIIEIKRF